MASRGIPRTTLGEGASHEGFLRHKGFRWLKIALLLCLAAGLAYVLVDVQPRPSGGSWSAICWARSRPADPLADPARHPQAGDDAAAAGR